MDACFVERHLPRFGIFIPHPSTGRLAYLKQDHLVLAAPINRVQQGKQFAFNRLHYNGYIDANGSIERNSIALFFLAGCWSPYYSNVPVLTTHGNPPVAIGGPPVATGGGKLDYMEAFPSVATGGPPMDDRWKIRKFRK